MLRTNHELAKVYRMKQKALGRENLWLELWPDDRVKLLEVMDKDNEGKIVIPSFITEMLVQHKSLWNCGKGVFDKCRFTDIFIDNPNNINISCDAMFSCMKSDRIRVQFANPERITDMSYMFYGCTLAEEIELVNFNSTNTRSTRSMFEKCRKLKSINFGGMSTSQVRDMSSMFKECTELRQIDFSALDTVNVRYMSGIFDGCNIEKLKVKDKVLKQKYIEREME